MTGKPVIGVPADRRMVDPHPFHMAGEKYVQAVVDGSDGLPFIIPALGDPLDVDPALLQQLSAAFRVSLKHPSAIDEPLVRHHRAFCCGRATIG